MGKIEKTKKQVVSKSMYNKGNKLNYIKANKLIFEERSIYTFSIQLYPIGIALSTGTKDLAIRISLFNHYIFFVGYNYGV